MVSKFPAKCHLLIVSITAGYTCAFLALRIEWSAIHYYNEAFGNASLILASLAMTAALSTHLTNWHGQFQIYLRSRLSSLVAEPNWVLQSL